MGSYYNENFVRDAPTRVLQMKYRVVHGDVVGAAAATMASGGNTHAAAAAALAAAAIVEGKKNAGKKRGKGKRKADDMDDYPAHSMGGMDPRGFSMQPWNNPYGNTPMNMMHYFQMMMAAQSFAFNNYMQARNNQDSDFANNQDSNDANSTPQKQFPYFPFPTLDANMSPYNMQNMPFQGDMMQQYANEMQSPASGQHSPSNQNSMQDAKQDEV